MKTLTNEQIKNLFKFTKKHYVEWYDLQSELVDHLANDIEQIWKKEPDLSFEQAKTKAFSKFGVFGFMDVVENKQKALGKQYAKLIWKELIQFFTIPKIVLTISMFFSLLFFIRLIQYNQYVIFAMLIVLVIFPFVSIIRSRRKVKIKEKNTGKKWLFEDYVANFGNMIVLINFPSQMLIHFPNTKVWPLEQELLFVTIYLFFSVLFYIAIYIIPLKVNRIMEKTYPNYQVL